MELNIQLTENPIPENIAAEPTAPVDTPVDLSTSDPQPVITPQETSQRIFKTGFGLLTKPIDIPPENIKNAYDQGKENELRRDATSQLNVLEQQKKSDAIYGILKKDAIDATPSAETLDKIKNYNIPMPYEPNSVLERRYSEQYLSELDRYALNLGDSSFWHDFTNQFPTSQQKLIKDFGTENMAKFQYIQRALQDVEDVRKNQSWIKWGADTIPMALPVPYNPIYEAYMRGNVPGVNPLDGLAGTNIDKQREAMWNMPFSGGFTQTVDTIKSQANIGGNAAATSIFLHSMLGQDWKDRTVNNLNTVAIGADFAGLLSAGWRGLKSAATLKQAQKAVGDVIQASTKPDVAKPDILASVGDVKSAGTEEASRIINGKLTGEITPSSEAIETLTRNYRWDKSNDFNSADLSDNHRNILMEQTDAAKNTLIDSIKDRVSPTRVPMEGWTPEQLKIVSEKTLDRYPGVSNNIMYTSDPVRDPVAKTFEVTSRVGATPADPFNSIEQAAGYANQHGLRVSLDKDQILSLDARIAQLKEEVGNVDMHDDAAGLTHIYNVEKELKDMQAQRKLVDKPGGYLIKQQGAGFYIEFKANVSENSSTIRDLIFTPENKQTVSPNSWTNYLGAGFVRTAEDTMAPQMNAMRKTAIYPQSRMANLAAQESQLLSDLFRGSISHDPVTGEKIPWYKPTSVPGVSRMLAKGEWKTLNEVLAHNQKMADPKDGIQGYYFQNYDELNYHYHSIYQRSPSWAETQAYFAVKRWDEYDRVLREVATYRNYARLGGETHEIVFSGHNEGDVRSPPFNGITHKDWPGGNGNILIATDNRFTSEVKDLRTILGKNRTAKEEMLRDGKARLIQVIDPEQLPFKDIVKDGDRRIEWVLAPNLESRPLTWEQVPRRGGGHLVFDYDHYIKQPNVRSETIGETIKTTGSLKHWYEGDNTYSAVKIRAAGEDYANRLNNVRKLLKAEKFEEAKEVAKPLGRDWADIHHMFYERIDSEGIKHKPTFSLDYDFRVVPKDRSIIELDKALKDKFDPRVAPTPEMEKKFGTFIDGTKSGSLARNFQVEFTGKRDARGMFAVENKGTVENPHYNILPAEPVKPLEIMSRSLSKIIRSSSFEDYKIAAVEHWLQEAIPHMKEDRSTIEASPFHYFRTATRDSFLRGDYKQVAQVNKLLANKFKIEQLVGQPSFFHTWTHALGEHVADLMYNTFGPGKTALTPIWLMDKLTDPVQFLRSATFNVFLGFGYLAQIPVQAQTYFNVWSHAPRYATIATYASYLHSLTKVNRTAEILAALDEKATKLNVPGMPRYRPGWFTEANKFIYDSGFRDVGGEYGALDIQKQAKVIQGIGGKVINALQWPFKFGEKLARIPAAYTAHLEWREANPTRAFDLLAKEQVLNKADLYYNNMSTASHSMLNSGPLSLATQFMNYQRQLAEIFWSGTGRTGDTLAQRNLLRARLLGVNATLYGIPAGLGITGFGIYDWIRKSMLEGEATIPITGTKVPLPMDKPYSTTDEKKTVNDWVQYFSMEGGFATIDYMLTKKSHNYGERWSAASGIGQVNDILSGDATFWKTIAGASSQTSANFFGEFSHQMGNLINGSPDDPKYTPSLRSIIDVGSTVSQTVNKTNQLVEALNTGKWVDKNSAEVRDVSPYEAGWMYVTGTVPTEQSDSRRILMNLKDQQAVQREGVKYVTREVNRHLLALNAGNQEQADEYYTNALSMRARFGLNEDQMATAVARGLKDQGSMIQKVAMKRYIDSAPPHLKAKMEETFSSIFNYVDEQGK